MTDKRRCLTDKSVVVLIAYYTGGLRHPATILTPLKRCVLIAVLAGAGVCGAASITGLARPSYCPSALSEGFAYYISSRLGSSEDDFAASAVGVHHDVDPFGWCVESHTL